MGPFKEISTTNKWLYLHPVKSSGKHWRQYSRSVPPPPQRSFTAAVRLYETGDYRGAIALFEEALEEYFKADVECRALCQSPQRFEGYDYLRYRYSLHEVISGKSTYLNILHSSLSGTKHTRSLLLLKVNNRSNKIWISDRTFRCPFTFLSILYLCYFQNADLK